jgi:branched-chain amino acid transport system permease protein
MLANELKKSFLVSLWFMFLTFPIMVIRVNTVENIIEWRWTNLLMVGVGSFLLSALWRYLIRRKEQGIQKVETGMDRVTLSQRLLKDRRFTLPALIVVCVMAVAFPFVFSIYQTNIMITAMIYVLLGLGLNIVVGVAGLLDLGYAAFYAVGAYSYACSTTISGWFLDGSGHRCRAGGLVRHHIGLSRPAVAGGLSGHRDPGIR